MVIFPVLTVFHCFLRLVHRWYSLGRPVTIGTPMVLSVFGDWFSVPFVKNSQKTVKIATVTIGVLIVTCQRRVSGIHKAAQTPLPCETSITICAWAVATARCPWSGLTVCVYTLHGRPCVWLPFAAACGYTLFYQLMMPAARLVCQRPSSNFPYFRTPLANFLLSRPNSVYTVILKQLLCCHRLKFVRDHSSKVELAATGVHPVGMLSSHASV